MVNVVIRTGVVFHVNTETRSALEIFYRNIRSVSTKRTELFDKVCYVEFQIVCLNETCLNNICFCHKLFPISFSTVRSDMVSSTKSSAAVLTAVSSAVGTYKHKCDLQVCGKRSWSKLAPNLPAVYLLVITAPPHDTKPDVISIYLPIFQKNLDTKKSQRSLIGDFCAPNFPWLSGLPCQTPIFIQN